MTPPNRVFTVFFWGKKPKQVVFQAGQIRIFLKGGSSRGHCYQLLRHLLDLGDEVSEELRHVLLLASVQWLLVHRVGLAEWPRVVGLPLAFLHARKQVSIRNTAAAIRTFTAAILFSAKRGR